MFKLSRAISNALSLTCGLQLVFEAVEMVGAIFVGVVCHSMGRVLCAVFSHYTLLILSSDCTKDRLNMKEAR